jgi:hypothetical protein
MIGYQIHEQKPDFTTSLWISTARRLKLVIRK